MAEGVENNQNLPLNPPVVAPANEFRDEIWYFNTTHLPFKLTHTNYPTWKDQVYSLLKSKRLLHFIDPAIPTPLTPVNPNPAQEAEFIKWEQQDFAIRHALLTSLTEPIVPYISSSKTSKAVCSTLNTIFANSSRSRIQNLRQRLVNLKQGDKSVTDFLYSLQGVADALASAGRKIDIEDFIHFALNGLNENFKDVASSIRNSEIEHTFESFLNRLVAEEEHLRQSEFFSPTVVTANFAQSGLNSQYPQSVEAYYAYHGARPNQNPAPSWRPPTSQYFSGQQTTPVFPWMQQPTASGYYPGAPPNQQSQNSASSNLGSGTGQAQNQTTYQNNKGRGKGKKKRGCGFCDQLGHHVKICPRLAGISPVANVAQQGTSHGSGWLLDSGASHHVTNNAQILSNATDYTGTDSLVIGNGSENGGGLVPRYE